MTDCGLELWVRINHFSLLLGIFMPAMGKRSNIDTQEWAIPSLRNSKEKVLKELLSRAPSKGEAPVTPGQAIRALDPTSSSQSLEWSCLPEVSGVAAAVHSPAAVIKELLRLCSVAQSECDFPCMTAQVWLDESRFSPPDCIQTEQDKCKRRESPWWSLQTWSVLSKLESLIDFCLPCL